MGFFIQDFPNSPLDGELWTQRNDFQSCVSIVRKQKPIDEEWRRITYRVFDAPALDLPFEVRYRKLQEVLGTIGSQYLRLHPHVICQGKDHLREELEKVEQVGGEGLMLRDPKSKYVGARSRTLMKVKTEHDDEAEIIGYEREAGRVKSLVVRNHAGVVFEVGSGLTERDRARPPGIGTTITYKYRGFTASGKPRFATYFRKFPNE
eukprot:TRINITY_DN13969_c0_g2_i2.p1 TRINITY_DN13969_c0_g2~~TRINITY_DN13969_c0_g2_i2.p1  ORF type:complete len:206 (-),score=34.96 TRINITY_DN13969_c0_g2_i2:370-987(-)